MIRAVAIACVLALCACDQVYQLHRDPDAGAPGDWTAITAGNGMTCGLREGGRLWCWGYNRFGQVGVGRSDPEVSEPVQVLPSTVWKSVTIGWSHACGIQADDSLWCWGNNNDGQLGNGTVDSERAPILVGFGWAMVAAGGESTCGIELGGALKCWGRGTEGQLGDGTRLDRISPVATQLVGAKSVTVGRRHACALVDDGLRYCWGSNAWGELGIGTLVGQPVPVPGTERPGEERWAKLSAGDQVTCGIVASGSGSVAGALRCWGENRSGQLGDTTSNEQRADVLPVATDAVDWIDVQVGSRFACARRKDRSMWCWGDIASVSELESTRAPEVLADGAPWDAIAVGRTHVCRIAPDRGLYCAGDGSAGQRGDGTTTSTTPQLVAGAWDRVDAGGTSTCAIAEGKLSCWGDNWLGQIGDDTYLRRLMPTAVSGMQWTSIAVGEEHACGSRASEMTCWGTNSSGSLGAPGVTRDPSPRPTIPNVLATQLDVSDHACAIVGTTELRCWGRNSNAESGSSVPILDTPTSIDALGASAYRGVATGIDHTCIIANDDKARCVGANNFGQLGDTTLTGRFTWAGAAGSLKFRSITAGYFHTCAIELATPTGRCWGRSADGALGDGTQTSSPTAVEIAGAHAWTQLAGGELHTCGIDASADLYCWGGNQRGQLGDGTLERKTTPTKIDSVGGDWTSVTTGRSHTCARKASGEVYCWGDNRDGQLGTGAGWSREFTLVPTP